MSFVKFEEGMKFILKRRINKHDGYYEEGTELLFIKRVTDKDWWYIEFKEPISGNLVKIDEDNLFAQVEPVVQSGIIDPPTEKPTFIKFEPGMRFRLNKSKFTEDGYYRKGFVLVLKRAFPVEYEAGGSGMLIILKDPISGNTIRFDSYELDEFLEFLG